MTDSEAQALRDLLTNKDVEIEKLHRLLTRAADALEETLPRFNETWDSHVSGRSRLIAELRKAVQ